LRQDKKPIYSKETGLRITTFAVGIHGETIEELLKKAVKDYPTLLIFFPYSASKAESACRPFSSLDSGGRSRKVPSI